MGERLGVIYLAWGPLGPQPLASFLHAYRTRTAGAPHELVVVFNGVAREGDPGVGAETRAALLGELDGVEHRLLELQRPVLDLAAYFQVAGLLEHEQLCFLNSYSEPLLDSWLALLLNAASAPRVGMVGATASWASQSSHVRYLIGLGGPYSGVYGDRERIKRVFAPPSTPAAVSGEQGERRVSTRAVPGAVGHRMRAARLLVRQLRGFPPFPAPHLRSNAFLLDRELMARIKTGPLNDKTDTYLLESGRRSLTRQIERMGLEVLVVGRDGVGYRPREWARSHTFWQGSQQNLIVADNQTRSYEHGDSSVRRVLSAHAWAELAEPAESDPGSGAQTLSSYGGPAPQGE